MLLPVRSTYVHCTASTTILLRVTHTHYGMLDCRCPPCMQQNEERKRERERERESRIYVSSTARFLSSVSSIRLSTEKNLLMFRCVPPPVFLTLFSLSSLSLYSLSVSLFLSYFVSRRLRYDTSSLVCVCVCVCVYCTYESIYIHIYGVNWKFNCIKEI